MNGSVYKRCSCPKNRQSDCKKNHGSWYFTHDLPATASASDRRKRTTRGGFATKRDAQQALAESLTQARHRARAADRPTSEQMLLADYLQRWLDGRQQLKTTTRLSYQHHIDRYLVPQLGHLPLEDLDVFDIEAMYDRLRRAPQERGRKPRLNPATIQRIHATLRKALNDAVRRRLLSTNPAPLVELESAPLPRADYWKSTGAGQFLDAIVDDRLYALFQLTLHRGLRRGEVVALQWKDVDLTRWTLDINHTLVQAGYQTIEEMPKSASSNRLLSIDRETVLALETHRSRQETEFHLLGRRLTADDYIFTREDGQPYHPEYVSKHLARLAKQAGVRPLTFHQLRHTAASLMLESGADIKYVQHVLGHEDMFITARIYAHVTARLDRKRSAQVATLIPRSRTRPTDDNRPQESPCTSTDGDTQSGARRLHSA